MNHIIGNNWNSGNKPRRIDVIVDALNCEGKADIEYFEGRWPLSLLPGASSKMNGTRPYKRAVICRLNHLSRTSGGIRVWVNVK